ncbi:MAG TPA: GNAT family N-acetyltransferase [Abditibacteriaceae bacterium]|jgi:GNAT superfamily N-acetyltransferase
MQTSDSFSIRTATVDDVPLILSLIKELAEYEKLSHAVVATEDDLRMSLFGARPAAEVVIGSEGVEPVGYALFFSTFSTFVGKPGIYLEDLYVRPSARRKGYGRALLLHLAQLAHKRGCGRLEWSVLDWNKPSINFYKSLGAVPLDDWTVFRLDSTALGALVCEPR